VSALGVGDRARAAGLVDSDEHDATDRDGPAGVGDVVPHDQGRASHALDPHGHLHLVCGRRDLRAVVALGAGHEHVPAQPTAVLVHEADPRGLHVDQVPDVVDVPVGVEVGVPGLQPQSQ